jgi:hypothetical protein
LHNNGDGQTGSIPCPTPASSAEPAPPDNPPSIPGLFETCQGKYTCTTWEGKSRTVQAQFTEDRNVCGIKFYRLKQEARVASYTATSNDDIADLHWEGNSKAFKVLSETGTIYLECWAAADDVPLGPVNSDKGKCSGNPDESSCSARPVSHCAAVPGCYAEQDGSGQWRCMGSPTAYKWFEGKSECLTQVGCWR